MRLTPPATNPLPSAGRPGGGATGWPGGGAAGAAGRLGGEVAGVPGRRGGEVAGVARAAVRPMGDHGAMTWRVRATKWIPAAAVGLVSIVGLAVAYLTDVIGHQVTQFVRSVPALLTKAQSGLSALFRRFGVHVDTKALIALHDPGVEFHSVFAAVGGGTYYGHDGMRSWHGNRPCAWSRTTIPGPIWRAASA